MTSFFPNRNEEGKLILADQVCISTECAEFINYLLDQNAKQITITDKQYLMLGLNNYCIYENENKQESKKII